MSRSVIRTRKLHSFLRVLSRRWGSTNVGAHSSFWSACSGSFEHPGGSLQVGVGVCRAWSARRRRAVASTIWADTDVGFDTRPDVMDPRRAPLGRTCRPGLLCVVPSVRSSFDGPYNLRLHLTAPREHRSHSVRGESRDFKYGTGARAHTINVGYSGGPPAAGISLGVRFATA